jgi:multidrug resistance protein MdtO
MTTIDASMPVVAEPWPRRALTWLRRELDIRPARARLIGRMTGLCTLVAVLSMALQVPEAAISAYLVFFVTKEDAISTTITGLGVIAAATVGIVLTLLFFSVVMDEPGLRLPLMVVMIFVGMYFSRISSVGPIGFALGFITTLALTAADLVPIPEIVVRGLLWLWVIAVYPTALVVLANLALGHRPGDLFRQRVALALRRLSDGIAGHAPLDADAIRDDLSDLSKQVAGNRDAKVEVRQVLIAHVDQLAMVASQTMADESAGPAIQDHASRVCTSLATAVQQERETADVTGAPATDALPPSHAALFHSLDHVGRSINGLRAPDAQAPASKSAFLVKDAFTNPEYLRFALKTTLACMVAYLIYTGLSWPGIRTALITCFFVALSSHGETMHKLRMRMVGAAVGAAMGMASIMWIIPRLDSVGGLAVLVAAGTLPAAWLATGRSRYSYAGWQVAFAFFLCVLHGLGPSGDMVVARDRLIGIFLGNIVMTVVFTHLWPVRHRDTVFAGLASAVDCLRAWMDAPSGAPAEQFRLAADFQGQVKACREGLHLLRYEKSHPHDVDAAAALRLVESLWVPAMGLVNAPVDDDSRARHRAELSSCLVDLAADLRAGSNRVFQASARLSSMLVSLRGTP